MTPKRQVGMIAAIVIGVVVALGVLSVSMVVVGPQALAQDEPDAGIPPIVWELTEYVDAQFGPTVIDDPELYTVQFLPDGTIAVRADCNRALSPYETAGSALELGPLITTLVHCGDESFGSQFLDQMNVVTSYVIVQEGASDELVLGLMADGGFLHFKPSLMGVIWEWESFQGGDDSEIAPADPSDYTIEFMPDGMIQGQIDCNRGFGTYEDSQESLSIMLATTRMACGPTSHDADFNRILTESTSYVIRDGMLAMALPADAGIALFSPVVDLGREATPETSS